MERTRRFVTGPGNSLRSHRLCGAVLTAGLLGGLWGLGEPIARGAERQQRTTTCRLAMPIKFTDLIRLLNDPRPAIRLEAINCLSTLNRPGTETVPALLGLFNDPDLDVRVQAVRVAVRSGLPAQQCVNVASQLLIPDRPDVCVAAMQVLSEAGPAARDALPHLHHCLTSSSLWVRLHAARAAIKIDVTDAPALNTLRAAQEDGQPEVREFASAVMSAYQNGEITQLKNRHPQVQRSAANPPERSGTSAASSMEPLPVGISDPDLLVRARAVRAAHVAGAPRHQIVTIASELLLPERADVTRVVASVLADIGPGAADALPRLHICLNSTSLAVRLHAAEAVVHIDPNDLLALDELENALDHQEFEVRYFAVNVLGAAVRDSDQAVFALQRALCDSHPKVSTAAALQLSRMYELTRQALPDALRPTAVDVAKWISELSNTAVDVRRTAAIRLMHAGHAARKTVPELIAHLGDGDPVVQLYVAQAIWQLDRNGYAILPVLFDLLLTNRGNARIAAVYTLGQMGPAAADTLPWLTRLLNDSKSFDKLLLADTIARIEPARRSATEILIGALHSHNTDVRYLSTVALGAAPLARQAAAEQALREVAADSNSRVRSAASEALGHWQARQEVARAARSSSPGTVVPAAATSRPRR